jgi:hypothetical protein
VNVIQHAVPVKPGYEPFTVDAIEPVPGLVVYEIPTEVREPDTDFHWRVSHHSGLALAAAEFPGDAQSIAHAIADFTDWTRTAEELQADTSLDISDLYQRINYETPGVFLHRRPA